MFTATHRVLAVGTFVSFIVSGLSAARAEEAGARADSLEEVVVTAERRSQDLQKVASSVVVVSGEELAEQGKLTTRQILEDIPNVSFAAGLGGDNPDGNITIRGVRSTQNSAGLTPGPSATATYVDDVYQGIGGNYDLSRVEVLRGPQGTLYGRSATGGVVSFHTNDPELGKTSIDLKGEYGTADLRDGTLAVNVPLSDTVAVRVAGHQYERHGFWSRIGGAQSILEGRIKLLYQPSDALRLVLAASTGTQTGGSGGNAPVLVKGSPDTINYIGSPTTASRGAAAHTNQFSATLDYDFGPALLTYIGALHTYGTQGTSGPTAFFSGVQSSVFNTPLDQFHTQELRLASNGSGPVSWLIGASFFGNMHKASSEAIQNVAYTFTGDVDTNPGATDAFIWGQSVDNSVKDYGLFTEETWTVNDRLRLTGGARFDRTDLRSKADEVFNASLDQYLASLNPPDLQYFSSSSPGKFNNVTYKARAEYDLSARNMVYGMISTGFLPGDAQLSPVVHLDFGNPANPFQGVTFAVLPFKQERLTSFEVGSKNRFLDDRLQLNAAAFYYKYQGYQEAVNAAPAGSPIPQFVVIALPVRMYGLELDAQWALGANDRISLAGGLLNNEITSFPDIGGGLGNAASFINGDRLSGIPQASATLGYAHTFQLTNGSKLEGRADLRYSGDYQVATLTQSEAGGGQIPYNQQKAYAIGNAGLTWTSPASKYSLTGYVRNVGNTIYKQALTPNAQGNLGNILLTPSDPRTYGVQVSAHF